MELERYQVLLCAIEKGSLTAAAEKMGYTPSGISRMMAALEEENGFPLLLRERDGVRPTADCERMLPAIREMLFHGEQCRQLAAKIRGLDVGTVTVGTAYSAFYLRLAGLVSKFHLEYPGIQIQFQNGYSSELVALLEQHRVDMCIVSRREGNHEWIPLCEDELMAWVPAGHPLARLDALPVSAFETEPYIDTYPQMDIDNRRVFEKYHICPKPGFSTTDSFASYSMVAAGLGISMNNALNSPSGMEGVKIMPLEPAQKVEIGLAVSPNKTQAAWAFLDFMKTFNKGL